MLSGGKVAGVVDARKVTKEEVGLLMLSNAKAEEAEAVKAELKKEGTVVPVEENNSEEVIAEEKEDKE